MKHTATLAAAAAVLSAGCAAQSEPSGAEVDFRVLAAADDDPYAGGATLVVALESERQPTPVEALRFPIDALEGRAPLVPDGDGHRFRVDVEAVDGLLLARGRSLPFHVVGGRSPAQRPDVLVGSLGRFVSPTDDPPPAAAVAGIAPTAEGALVATADGTLYVYRLHHHDPTLGVDGEATLRLLARQPGREGARWVDVGEGLLLGVGGAQGGASLHQAGSAEPVAILEPAALASHRYGAAVAALPGMAAALVLGGAAGRAEPPTAALSRIDVRREGDALRLDLAPSGELATPRRDAAAIGVPVDDDRRTCPCARVVLIGGSDGASRLSTAELVDPLAVDPPRTAILDAATEGAALAVVDRGLVLVAGGRAADGTPVADVRVLSARPDMLVAVSPPPEPLPSPRSHAAAVRFDPSLVLLFGGRGGSGTGLRGAEIYDFQVDRFGAVDPTGVLPQPFSSPVGVPLADGTVLAVDEAGAAVYLPPRGTWVSGGTAAAP